MIKNYSDYKYFRKIESKQKKDIKNFLFPDVTSVFLKRLRQFEWHYNSNGIMHKILSLIAYSLYRKISIKTGISIPRNTCEAGLSIPHFGSIVVNGHCKIGKNCRIHNNVNIGANKGSSKAPKIGDNVYIGPGAVIFGDIEIADNCYIGANAVVNKSFLQPYSVIAGIPARVIKIETKNWCNNKVNHE